MFLKIDKIKQDTAPRWKSVPASSVANSTSLNAVQKS